MGSAPNTPAPRAFLLGALPTPLRRGRAVRAVTNKAPPQTPAVGLTYKDTSTVNRTKPSNGRLSSFSAVPRSRLEGVSQKVMEEPNELNKIRCNDEVSYDLFRRRSLADAIARTPATENCAMCSATSSICAGVAVNVRPSFLTMGLGR